MRGGATAIPNAERKQSNFDGGTTQQEHGACGRRSGFWCGVCDENVLVMPVVLRTGCGMRAVQANKAHKDAKKREAQAYGRELPIILLINVRSDEMVRVGRGRRRAVPGPREFRMQVLYSLWTLYWRGQYSSVYFLVMSAITYVVHGVGFSWIVEGLRDGTQQSVRPCRTPCEHIRPVSVPSLELWNACAALLATTWLGLQSLRRLPRASILLASWRSFCSESWPRTTAGQ